MYCLIFEGLGTVFLHGKPGVRSRRGFIFQAMIMLGLIIVLGG